MYSRLRIYRLAAGLVLAPVVGLAAATPASPALAGWARYISIVEERTARETRSEAFLGIDAPERAADRRRVMSGELVTTSVLTRDAQGKDINIPDALIHDWRGDVFIEGATVDRIVSRLEHEAPPAPPNEVLSSRLLEHGPGWNRVALILQRRKVITIVYATEHHVTFERLGDGRATSTSIATSIREIEDYGTPQQKEAAEGDDHGFLWRWNAYWRFTQTSTGVIAECESVSLSRDVPALVRMVAGPIIRGTARESMTSALEAMRAAFAQPQSSGHTAIEH
jgi:hypothetical protein